MTASTISAEQTNTNISPNDRIIERDSTGRLWYAGSERTSGTVFRFWYSDNEGLTWTEATGLQITVPETYYVGDASFWINAEHDFAAVVLHWRTSGGAHDDGWYWAANFDENSTWISGGSTPNLCDNGTACGIAVMSLPNTSNVLVTVITPDAQNYPVTMRITLQECSSTTGALIREYSFLQQGTTSNTYASRGRLQPFYKYQDFDKATLVDDAPDLYVSWYQGLERYLFSPFWPYYGPASRTRYSLPGSGVGLFGSSNRILL